MAAWTSATPAIASTANAGPYTTASFTPAASDLLVALVHMTGSATGIGITDTQSLGWTLVKSALSRASADNDQIWVSNGLAAASAMTVSLNATSPTGATLEVFRLSGMTLTGASAVRQSGSQDNQSAATPNPAFPGAAATGNPLISLVGNQSNPAGLTVPTGWAAGNNIGFATPTTGSTSATKDSGFTGSSVAWGSSSASAFGSVAAEFTVGSIITKTQSAIAHIATNPTKTQSAIAHITAAVTKTQSAVSRIATNLTKTQPAIARIATNPTATQPATARVANNITKTQPAVADIAQTVTKTQSATANITSGGVSATNLLSNGSATDASSYATASITPSANRLYLATVSSRTGITVNPNQPTLTGAGLTWDVVDTVVYDDTSSSRRRLTTFRAMGSGSAGALTFDFGGQTQTSADWVVDELQNVDTSGSNGAGAIVQHVTNFDDTGTATTLTTTLAAFSSSSNATYGAAGFGNPPNASTAGSGFTKLGDFQEGEGGSRVTSEFKATNDTTVDMSFAAGGEIGIIALEIKVFTPTFTKTQSAVARIANIVSRTQSAVSRIANNLTKTQASGARIAVNKTLTQPAIARIAKNLTKTQSAIAHITSAVTKVQTATARIVFVLTKTQTSIARIAKNFTKTQSATARISIVGSKTQSATARIVASLTKTQSAISRIANRFTKTQSATAKISVGAPPVLPTKPLSLGTHERTVYLDDRESSAVDLGDDNNIISLS